MPPQVGEASSSSRSASQAVKIPTRNDSNPHSSQSGHLRRQPNLRNRYANSMASEEDSHSFSSGSFASSSSTGSYPVPNTTRGPHHHHTSTSAFDSSPQDLHLDAFSSSSEDSYDPRTPSASSNLKMKAKAVDQGSLSNPSPLLPSRSSPLGPAMLSSHTYKSVNLNGPDPDDPPRLITFTKAGQGFTWNEELFLPSYMIGRYARGRRKQYDGDLGEDDVEVTEIFVTDEEAVNMMP